MIAWNPFHQPAIRGRHQAIIRTNTGIFLIWSSETNFREILIEIYKFLFKEMRVKMSAKMWPICRSINVLKLDVN